MAQKITARKYGNSPDLPARKPKCRNPNPKNANKKGTFQKKRQTTDQSNMYFNVNNLSPKAKQEYDFILKHDNPELATAREQKTALVHELKSNPSANKTEIFSKLKGLNARIEELEKQK